MTTSYSKSISKLFSDVGAHTFGKFVNLGSGSAAVVDDHKRMFFKGAYVANSFISPA